MADFRAENQRVAFVLAQFIFVVLGNRFFTVSLLPIRLNACRAFFIILSLLLPLSELMLVLLSNFRGCFKDFCRFVEGNLCTFYFLDAEASLQLVP